jgi:hypothetical protein
VEAAERLHHALGAVRQLVHARQVEVDVDHRGSRRLHHPGLEQLELAAHEAAFVGAPAAGVVGAFAISNDIFEIALGLGIGAMYIRSLTVFLVRKGTLDDYVYLEHGAHYAIGALAFILLATIKYDISEVVTGLVGVVLIAASYWSSVVRNRRIGEDSEESDDDKAEVTTGV